MKCLIVEDNKQNYDLLQRMLNDYGISRIAVNGVEALTAFKQAHAENDPYDVIFLDIMMPDLNGDEVLRKIRQWEKENTENNDNVQVVMASAKSDTDTIISSYDDGCQHFFIKPYDRSELDELMKTMGFEKTSNSF